MEDPRLLANRSGGLLVDPVQIDLLKEWLARRPDAGDLEPVEMTAVLVEPDAIFRLVEAIRLAGARERGALLVTDPTPMRRQGQDLKSLVRSTLQEAGVSVWELSLPPDSSGRVSADFSNVDLVRQQIRPNCAVVGLGPGTVADVAKHACFLREREDGRRVPLVICPTANTVTAYSANMAVLARDGVKRTWPSRYPDVVVADLRTLAEAPRHLAVAGLGDCCPIFVSYADWYIAHKWGFEPFYSETPLELFANLDRIFLDNAAAVASGSLEGAGILAKVIILAGIAQSVVRMSRPFSGLEHVVLHLLDDVVAPLHGRALPLHGAQAGVATVIAAAAYEEFLDSFDPAKAMRAVERPLDEMQAKHALWSVFDRFDSAGELAQTLWNEYQPKVAVWNENRERVRTFIQGWDACGHKTKIKSLVRPAATVAAILHAAGGPLSFEELTPPVREEEYRSAFVNAPYSRRRFTLLDVLHFLGMLDETFMDRALGRARAAISSARSSA